ncbi:MAG: hypothetical protein ABR517_00750 [Thermoanaerobaculia bacterium]
MVLSHSPSLATPDIGAVAPDFTLHDHEGQAQTLSDGSARRTLLVFYRGHW